MKLRNMILVLALVMAAATPAFPVTLEFITSPSTALGGWDLTYDGSLAIDTESLRPVGRLWGADYGTVGEILTLPRPRA